MSASKGSLAFTATRHRPRARGRICSLAAAAWLVAATVAGCADETAPPVERSADPPEPPVVAEERRPGIRFDPGVVRPGDTVGELVVDSVAAEPTVVDSTLVGTARFRGEIELSGRTMLHPEADLQDTTLCFEADPASGARLPRWAGDERRPWFCFVNQAQGRAGLGPPSGGVSATIVIDDFTIHRNLSDAVNSARFVRRVRGRP